MNLKSSIKHPKALLAALLILAIFLPLALVTLRHIRPVQAGWWPDGGTAWLNRKQLTLSNNSGGNLNANAVVTVTVDTQSLYNLGKLKSDCSDLRILYHPNSTTNKELTRYVGFPSGTTCATSTSSKVSFALQASLSNASNTTDYYLYYNNPDAATPTNNQTAFSVGSATATFVCPFDGSSTCLAAGTATPTTETGAVHYTGSKSALSFDGANDYVTTGNIGSDIKTVEFWVYPTSTTNYFVDLNGSAYISASSGTVSATGFTSPTIYVNGVATTTITANSWQHIAVTTTTAINASSTNIGKIASTYLAGYMDELRISNSVRYSAAFTTSTAPYVRDSYTKLLYHFDENGDDPRQTGKTIDDSGNGYHGTITGAKYVAGLVGVDTATTTTNKITNPSFENATYDTNWLSLTSFIGTGADGAISLTASKNLNTTVIGSSRSTYADGIAYRVIAPADSATSVTRYSGSDTISNGIAVNDEVLLINLQGASGDTADVGNYEFKIVSSVSSSTITFTSAITKSFDGTTASNQKVVIQRIPQYTDVTLTSSGSITASAWDALATTPTGAAGYLTGIVAFRANGTVSIGSGTSITANSLGFRGGAGSAPPSYSTAGEGYAGTGSASESANSEGGGGGLKNTDAGLRGTGAAGGGYGTAGAAGGNCTANCPTNPADSTGAAATSTYGTTALTTLFFGSGGGGNQDNSSRAGGKAGGIIFIGASTISNSGTISSNGAAGANYDSRMGGAGGGAGGSIFIASANPTLGTSLVTATGGNGGTGYSDGGGTSGAGGAGGVGRIRVEYSGSLSGTTSPAASTSQLSSNLTVTQNTTSPYYKYGANSAKIVASADGTFTTSIDAGSTSNHTLSAYVYNGTAGAVGGTVDATVAKLVYNGTAQTTTYTDAGSGWWRLTYSAAGINGSADYGVQVLSGKTVYLDGVQLESESYATSYVDGSLGTGYSWAGTANNSISTGPTTTNTGNVLRQSYAGHEGVMIEEATTNKITNPSFENATYNTNWTVQTQPSDVSGLGIWLKADALSLNDGDAVGSWTDSSGNSNHATQGTASKKPVYKTNIVNGKPVVRFQGTDDALNPSSFTHNEWFVVANITQNGNFNPTLTTNDGGNRYYLMTGSNSTIWYTGGASYDIAANTTVRKDGATYAADAITGAWHVFNLTGLSETNAPDIGWSNALSQYGVVDIAEIVAFNSAISSSNRLAIEKYLADKYAITVTSTNGIVTAKNTSAPYYKFGSSSIKIDTTNNAGRITTSINPGNTNTHMLSAYVYDGTSGNVGGTIDATVAKLVFRDSVVTTTYTDMGGGWWRLSYSAAAANAAENYGVSVSSSKTVYVDGVQLEEKAYATTYTDGSLGTGYSWTGTANNSTSTRAAADLRYANASNVSATAGSVSFWIKTPWAGNDGVAHTIADFQTSAGTLRIQKNAANNIILYDGTNTASKAVTWAANSWNHIAVDWGSSNMHVYVNSTAGTAAGAFSAPTLSTSMFLGQDTSNANLGDAVISDFRIYNAVLSANDVSDLYYSGLVGHSENIVIDRFGGGDTKGQDPLAVWHMDEGYGTTINDSSRNAKPLTASGATWESGIGNTRSSRARYLKFDGSTSYLSRAQDGSFDFGTGSFSLSGWFHHTSTAPASGTHTILARYGSAGFKVYMNTSGYVCFGIDADSTWSPADTACSGTNEGSLADSKWHHLEAVKNGTTSISLYIDGHLAQTTSVTATGSMNTASILYLGVDSTGNSNYWNGWLDEFMVYPYARSAAQVKTDLADPVSTLIGSSANDPLSQGLVGYWKMDESSWTNDCSTASVTDSSGNANNGKSCPNGTGITTPAAGKFGNAGSFDGTDDYLDVTDGATLKNFTSMTVSMWFNTTNWTNQQALISKDGNSGWYWQYTTGTSALNFYVSGSNKGSVGNPSTGVWHHLVATYDGTTIKTYLDGVAQTGGTLTGVMPSSTGSLFIGAFSASSYRHTGSIDETRIYNRALTPKEVRDLYNWAPGPVGYWNMDEHSGQSINDLSGNGYSGTLGANTSVATDDPSWSTGEYGGGLKFNGTSTYAELGTPANVRSTGTISVGGWVNWTSFASDTGGHAAISYSDSATNGFMIYQNTASPYNKIKTFLVTTSGQNVLVSNQALNTGQWYHVFLTYDGANVKLYINGILDISGSATGTITWTSITNHFLLGATYTSSSPNFSGKLDDVKIYNYARTQKQIVEDMNAGHPSVGSPVGSAVGYWKFDEGADNMCAGGANDVCNSGNGGSTLDGPQTGMATPATSTSGWTNSGKFGKALLFDGSDDKVAIPDNNYFTLPGDFTISAWIQTTSSSGTILGSYTNTGDIHWQFENSGGHPQLLYKATQFGATQSILGAGKLINDGSWHHVAGMRSGSTLYTYVDGVLDNTATGKLTTSINPVNPTNIGNSTTGPNYFTGTIDEVKLYHYALTADEIKLDYNRGSTLVLGAMGDNSSYQKQAANQEYCVPGDTTSCATPLAEWKFDEGTSTSAFDSTGNGVKGTLVNSPAWVAGKAGKALNFNGSNSYVTTTHQDALFNTITTAMTISGWVKPAAGSLSSRRDLIQRAGAVGSINGATAAKDIWWFNLQNSGKMNFYMGGITGAYVETTTAISDSVWTYLTVTYDGSSIRFYINGKLDKTSAASGTLLTGDNGVGIGANLSTTSVLTPFSGGIDMLRVWGYTRSPAQIAYDYNRGAPVAHYKFDECTGGSANDASGNGNTGTINIGASGSQTSTGTCGTSTATEAWSNGTTGKRNASIKLDGNDDYVATGAFSPLATAAVTTTKASWGGWFYPTSSAASLTLMEKATEFRLTTDANSKPVCGIYYSAAFTDATAGSTALTLSAWNHVMCTYDGANIKTYLNGSLVDTTANTNNITAASSILYMGENSSSAQRVTGQLDDIRVYNNALTATQIKTVMNEGAVRFGPSTGSP